MRVVGLMEFVVSLMIGSAVGDAAVAQSAPPPPPTETAFLDGQPGSLTVAGITVYGLIDVGYGYQSHGAEMNAHYTAAQAYIIQKASNASHWGFSPHGLSQSFVGIKGTESLADLTGMDSVAGWSMVFRGDVGFNPLSGDLSDSPKSLTQQNGVPLSRQSSSGDSSRAGQFFNGDVYVGVANRALGELRYGRNSNLMQEGLTAYDPQIASVAFSPFGYSGNAGGLGDTEDGRHDNSLKYKNTIGALRVGVDYAPWTVTGQGGLGYEFNVGVDIEGLSFDGVYGRKKDAIAASPLTATDCVYFGSNCNRISILDANISDNTAYALLGKYKLGDLTAFGGFERTYFDNPSEPLTSGGVAGGYNVFKYTNNAFTTEKVLDISWMGLRYALTSKVTVAGAWYHYEQNAYLAALGSPCKNAQKGNFGGTSAGISSNCGGREDILSATLDYQMTKRLDLYAGFGWSKVEGGLASGYLKTETIDPMVGARLKF